MASNLVVSGGPLHDFATTTAALTQILEGVGIESLVVEDPSEALQLLVDRPRGWDLVTVNALLWRMPADRHAHLRAEHAFELTDRQAGALQSHVRTGGGLLACHGAAICFDDNPLWTSTIGGAWDWDRSSHPPLGPAVINVTEAGRRNPLTAGLDDFTIVDEVYGFLDHRPDLVPLLTSAHGGVDHPVLWERAVGAGRVVVDLLGHDARSFQQPDHAEVLRRAGRWLTGGAAQASPTPRDGEATA